jgi:hypothetical protein
MTTEVTSVKLEEQIAEWRGYVRRRGAVADIDAEELEDHLRSTVSDLVDAGLREDEAFLVAVKRMGSLDDLSREFAREHSGRLWKQLVLTESGSAPPTVPLWRRDWFIMLVCAAVAAIAIKVPELLANGLAEEDRGWFYTRNLPLFLTAPLAAYFAWRRRLNRVSLGALIGLFVLGALGANAYPLEPGSQSVVLTTIHLVMALWLAVGVAYVGGEWLSDRLRMDFIRFTGEFFVYSILLTIGIVILMIITEGVFHAIDIQASGFVGGWLMPCAGAASVVVAAWLVEAKQSVVENMAPVLTRVFTPLFTAVMLAFVVAIFWTGTGIDVDRDVLIIFDVLLALVLGLLLYSISARDPLRPPGIFDKLQIALAISALFIDVLVLTAITGRIEEWGTTPNKMAALGENVILATNLAWTAWLLAEFIRGRSPFARLEQWQTRYVGVYALWAWTVVLVFPPLFGFM